MLTSPKTTARTIVPALRRFRLMGLSLWMLAALWALPVSAQGLSFIRDAEIERDIKTFSEPIFVAAGVAPQSVQLFLVNSRAINAFVAGGQRLYINTGLLMDAQNVNELIGVIAHETGHIAGGHLARGVQELERARTTALLTTLLGVAAGIAAGSSDVGVAVAASGTGVAGRQFLSFSRTMENSADQAALRYLDRAGYSSEGLADFLERLAKDELVPEELQSEYVRTHPLTQDRVSTVRGHAGRTGAAAAMPPAYEEAFARIRAKLLGFLDPNQALNAYAGDESIAGRYARAIAHYRNGDIADGLAGIDALIEAEPDNAFFHELRGQMLMENGQIAEALPSYEAAMAKAPGEPLIEMAFAQAALQGDDAPLIARAVEALESATRTPTGATPLAFRLLATGYGKQGDIGQSALALAEEALARGDRSSAVEQARRADALLEDNRSAQLRARDILAIAERP